MCSGLPFTFPFARARCFAGCCTRRLCVALALRTGRGAVQAFVKTIWRDWLIERVLFDAGCTLCILPVWLLLTRFVPAALGFAGLCSSHDERGEEIDRLLGHWAD